MRDTGKFMSQDFASQFQRLYLQQPSAERKLVLQMLGRDFGVGVAGLRAAARLVAQDETLTVDDRRLQNHVVQLQRALQPAHASLFATLAQLPDGMAFILNLRGDTVRMLRDDSGNAALRAVDDALRTQLQAWFALGFLHLRQITWETSAELLEKIIKYEAVHSIRDWTALKQRLVGPRRRCFAFFHPSLPSEPLVFVEVALLQDVANSIQAILEEPVPAVTTPPEPLASSPTTAVFYSITSAQAGLTGIDLGNYLIKDVVRTLKSHHSSLETFVTLSPLPGFAKWLNAQLVKPSARDDLLLLSDVDTLAQALGRASSHSNGVDLLQQALSRPDWAHTNLQTILQPILLRLGARYLYLEKHRSLALDPVANFHIRNGAWLWRLNWLADTSAKGLTQSYGLMVNYRYILDDISANNQQYLEKGAIAVSDQVKSLL